MKSADAYKTLEGAGLHHADGIGTFATPDKSKLYTIATQDPPAGQYAKPGQVVALAIYNVVRAPQNADVKATIPNVFRMDAAQAKQLFANLGFKKIKTQNSRTTIQGENGKVTGQWPAPGISFSTAQEIIIQIGVYGK
jgi:beta-lactam-binding protein with PASTA domain